VAVAVVNVTNAPKLVGILLAMVLLTIVFALGTFTESGYLGLMGLIVGYLVGNGVAARNGDPVQPVIGESPEHRERHTRG
jgi:hypothetical protein